MNKLIKRLAVLSVGLTMAIGAGVAAFGHGKGEVAKAAEGDAVKTLAGITSGGRYYIRATTNSGDYYWKANGGLNVGTVLSGSSTQTKSESPVVTLIGSGSSWAIRFDNGNYLSLPSTKNNGKYNIVNSVANWTVTEADGVLNFKINGYCLQKNSSTSLNFGSYASGQKDIWLEEAASAKTLSSISLSKDDEAVKTQYVVGDSASTVGLTVTAHYDDASTEDVTSLATITPNPATVAAETTSISYTATYSGKTSNSVTVNGITIISNPIAALYTKASSASVDVYGYYVGFLDGTGPVIMDGEYGIVVYNKTADVSHYTAKETILHVTGSISIYAGLYEIGSATISVASGTFEQPDEPIVHVTNGNETADQASRLTTVTGTPSLVSGSFDDAAGTADITMSFAVGIKTVQVFYKKAAQTGDAEAFAAIKDAVANSSEITIKGFTGWYNKFQVQMNGYVPAAAGYTAEDFAEDLLAQTDAADVCGDYEPDESHYAAIKAKLVAIWSDLAGAEKYPSLPSDQKTILAEANADEEGNTVEQAMARYDFLTIKYELSSFINGRLDSSVGNRVEINNNNSLIVVIAIISAVSLVALSTLLVLKKKHK